ncbi:MAG: NADP(H)-dependent aldo-keto reductase [Fibrobacteria bacterium]|nr:NADP(H)-dependent aldo-keto reductase [Fibrobacteria bacterium]
MKYNKLGTSDIKVSEICLGTMTWGEQNTEEEAHQQLDFALEQGINFIDTAEIYPVPPKEETYTLTESILGNWIKKKHNRQEIILATKVAGRAPGMPWIRGGKNKFDRMNIEEAIDRSLERLQTDYIDLYQLHWPNRITNFFGELGYSPQNDPDEIPIAETLDILQKQVEKGKIRHFGLSNETPWGVMTCLREADKIGLAHPVSIQNPYNLLNRTFEIGNAEVAFREKVGLLAYSPLGFGVLSGKYLKGQKPSGSRMDNFKGHFVRYASDQATSATAKYVKLAERTGLKPAQMALAFVLSRPYVTSAIIGATSLGQLNENIKSKDVEISEELFKKLDAIHLDHPNPAP